ncbi:NADH-ubiquinone oxidoreductase-like protein 299 kDa subunit [Saccharata proteae CBS 121410]|uniref:NADH-ubiquinone oxidoreductase-like protein 299 kDa subunit n=1 Tax=Saccharata proteae CBS 121410 TaxID=1314787 RepID=A0A9P4I4B4_9PEZI|nr:NADH-ubiquinone oxidoreductase-like protein 299 kDa subunit [Saccharata proteae CBS 121410]
MRAAARLLASVKPVFTVKAGAPTGLTGLLTHPAPRAHLMLIYNGTLEKLRKLPETSAYRTSTEALTKHRLAIVESIKPNGYDEWEARAREQIREHPAALTEAGDARDFEVNGTKILMVREKDETPREWDGEKEEVTFDEGVKSDAMVEAQTKKIAASTNPRTRHEAKQAKIEPPPNYTREQLSELEGRLGAGLIEEVIAVAEGERQLVDEMAKAKIWEELAEKPAEGQWKYFDRGDLQYTKTQKP